MWLSEIAGPGETYYLLEWIVRLAMLFVIPFRRNPAATRSWLLLIFFLPIPGVILFLAIGRSRFPKWRTARFKALQPFLAALAEKLATITPGDSIDPEIDTLVTRLGHLPAIGGNHVELLDDYDGVIDRLVADIDGARHQVRLLVYIFSDDVTGSKVIAALARAVARGVACHALIDPVGSHHWLHDTLRSLKQAGVEVRTALPFHLWRGRTRRDMRNHRKLFLIDGMIGYAGSQNLVAKNFRPGVTNKELVVRVMGPAVAAMVAVFLTDWYLESEILLDTAPAIPDVAGTATVQVLPSGADYPVAGFQALLIWQVHQACSHVVIVSPYLIPDDGLLGALKTAVLRGVEIDLIVSAIADQKLVNLAQSSYYEELMIGGVRIHRYRHDLLHAKNVSIDDRLAILGSSNVDIRSFQLNEEVSMLLFDAKSVASLCEIQRDYLRASDMIDVAVWRQRSGARKLVENMARLVSPLL